MPNAWVESEEYLSHNDVVVYNLYRDDYIDDSYTYWYTINQTSHWGDGPENGVFDIRDYGNPNAHNLDTDEGQEARMRELIELGVLGADEVVHEEFAGGNDKEPRHEQH